MSYPFSRHSSRFSKKVLSRLRIAPVIKASKHSLVVVEDKSPIEESKRETSTGNLACLELSKEEIQNTGIKCKPYALKYVSALSDSINNCFHHSLPVVASFRNFDPVSIPQKCQNLRYMESRTLKLLQITLSKEKKTMPSGLS